jgi:predicted GNAT family acetyltransferase
MKTGLTFEGKEFQGEYLIALGADKAVTGILAHYWTGALIMQAPEEAVLSALLKEFQRTVTRPVASVIGPTTQARFSINQLSLQNEAYRMNALEGLYSLDLDALPPSMLVDGSKVVKATHVDREVLRRWLRAYDIEALGRADTPQIDAHIENRLKQIVDSGDSWVLLSGDIPVALSGFNARLPSIVQVGPVWTPPEQRGKGYARCLVAETLRIAATEGVAKAVLFTDNPAAIRAYEAIGFRRIGEYQLAFLQNEVAATRIRGEG